MPAAKKAEPKKATKRRAARRKKVREKVENLGALIAEAVREAKRELPGASQEERRAWVVDLLNEKIDVPMLTEQHEAQVLELLVEVVSDIILRRRYGDHRVAISQSKQLISKLRK